MGRAIVFYPFLEKRGVRFSEGTENQLVGQQQCRAVEYRSDRPELQTHVTLYVFQTSEILTAKIENAAF